MFTTQNRGMKKYYAQHLNEMLYKKYLIWDLLTLFVYLNKRMRSGAGGTTVVAAWKITKAYELI
jgi:hypothetical protein